MRFYEVALDSGKTAKFWAEEQRFTWKDGKPARRQFLVKGRVVATYPVAAITNIEEKARPEDPFVPPA